MISILVALLFVGQAVDPVWSPGADCWEVYYRCGNLGTVRNFVQYMTGPGGQLYIRVRTHGDSRLPNLRLFKGYDIPISAKQLAWPMNRFDVDSDGDIDLRDWAAIELTLREF